MTISLKQKNKWKNRAGAVVCPDIKLPHCWTSAWMSGPLPAVLPHLPTGSYCIIPHPTMTPDPISANRSTTGETGEPMVEELAIWKTHLTQSAVNISCQEFVPVGFILRRIIGCVRMLHICHDFLLTNFKSQLYNAMVNRIFIWSEIQNLIAFPCKALLKLSSTWLWGNSLCFFPQLFLMCGYTIQEKVLFVLSTRVRSKRKSFRSSSCCTKLTLFIFLSEIKV